MARSPVPIKTRWAPCPAAHHSSLLREPSSIRAMLFFLRGIADYEKCQKLHDIVDEEEKRVKPELEKIRKEFARQKVRMLLVSGPANEVSIGKIIAEFGAEVFIVPAMKNKFMQQEKKILQDRYGVTFIEEDFDTVEDLVKEIKPTVVQVEFQAQVETVPYFIPTLINMFYLCEYGYDYALDLGSNFFRILHRPIYEKWQKLMHTYGGLQ